MTQIRQIEFVNAKGNTVRIILESETGALSNQKFEVTGIRFRWELSEFGFGGLNQIVTLDIFDDGIVFDLLATGRRQDVRIRIFINDKEIFRGFPDYEQLKRFPKRQEKREFQAVFYNVVGFKNEMSYNDQIQRTILDGGFTRDFSINFFGNSSRIATIFNSLFQEYDKNLLVNHDWESQQSDFVLTGQTYNVLNQTYLNTNFAFPQFDDLTFTELCNIVSRSFFFRYGYSYKHQAPLLSKITMGFDGSYQIIELGDEIMVGIGEAGTDGFILDTNIFLNDTIVHTPDYSVEVLDDFKINFLNEDVEQSEVEPYMAITYERNGEEHENRPIVFTQPNPDDTILADSFRYDLINHDANDDSFAGLSGGGLYRMFVLTESGGFLLVQPPLGFRDIEIGGFMDLTEIMAKSHMTLRSETNKNRSFVYKEILDPMIPYIWDNRIWHLWRGEYDLFSEETIVKDSIGYNYNDS